MIKTEQSDEHQTEHQQLDYHPDSADAECSQLFLIPQIEHPRWYQQQEQPQNRMYDQWSYHFSRNIKFLHLRLTYSDHYISLFYQHRETTGHHDGLSCLGILLEEPYQLVSQLGRQIAYRLISDDDRLVGSLA